MEVSNGLGDRNMDSCTNLTGHGRLSGNSTANQDVYRLTIEVQRREGKRNTARRKAAGNQEEEAVTKYIFVL